MIQHDTQPVSDNWQALSSSWNLWVSQYKQFNNVYIYNIQLYLRKVGNPTGNVTCTIRDTNHNLLFTSTDIIDASTLTNVGRYHNFSFPGVLLSGYYSIGIEFSGGDSTNVIWIGGTTPSVKDNEYLILNEQTGYSNQLSWDLYYDISYEISPPITQTPIQDNTIVFIVLGIGLLYLIMKRR